MPGWPTRGELIERYAAATGRDVSRIAYYEIFAIFKVAVVLQQIYYRYHVGQTTDARFAALEQRVVERRRDDVARRQPPSSPPLLTRTRPSPSRR